MSLELIVALAVMTYGSRALALVALPPLPPPVAAFLDRMPPALFAGLAAQALILPGGSLVGPAVLGAAVGALLAAPLRSLPVCLAAGLAGYLIVALLAG
jgi:branched-subunit amino acid transport protein